MRLYFHLRDKHRSIPDSEGVEVPDVAQARAAGLEMLRELREEDPSTAQEWSGWRLEATDAAGVVVFRIDLDSLV
jgi:hypothetical protein